MGKEVTLSGFFVELFCLHANNITLPTMEESLSGLVAGKKPNLPDFSLS